MERQIRATTHLLVRKNLHMNIFFNII